MLWLVKIIKFLKTTLLNKIIMKKLLMKTNKQMKQKLINKIYKWILKNNKINIC